MDEDRAGLDKVERGMLPSKVSFGFKKKGLVRRLTKSKDWRHITR